MIKFIFSQSNLTKFRKKQINNKLNKNSLNEKNLRPNIKFFDWDCKNVLFSIQIHLKKRSMQI